MKRDLNDGISNRCSEREERVKHRTARCTFMSSVTSTEQRNSDNGFSSPCVETFAGAIVDLLT